MKKTVSLILAVLLLLPAVLSLSACSDETARLERMSDEKRAQRLFKLAEEAIANAEQAVIYRHLVIKNPYFSSSCTEDETVSYVMTKDRYGYLSNTHSVLRTGGDGEISTTVFGYKDGYAFRHDNQSLISAYFKAPVEEKEFRTVTVKDSELAPLGLRIDGDSCKTVTARHMEDGRWKIICEGFGDAQAQSFLARQHDLAIDLTSSHKPWDLTVTATLSETFEPTLVTVEVVFHNSKEYPNAEPSALVQYDFTLGTEDAADNVSSIPLEKYTELSDLSTLTAFFDGLSAREKVGKGEFTVDTATTVKSGGESASASLSQTVTYGNAGGYRFTYTYEELSGKSYELAYAGTHLMQTTYGKMGNKIETKSTRMIDAHARLTVAGCMNPQAVTPADIETAKVISEGSGLYRYTLREDAAKQRASKLMKEAFPQGEVIITAVSGVLEAQMPNGMPESYTLTIYVDATVDDAPVSLEVAITVIFYDEL